MPDVCWADACLEVPSSGNNHGLYMGSKAIDPRYPRKIATTGAYNGHLRITLSISGNAAPDLQLPSRHGFLTEPGTKVAEDEC